MRGYLVTNAYLRGGSFQALRALFADAAARLNITLLPRTNEELLFLPRDGCAFALFYDKDIRLAAHLEQSGVRVFNSARVIALCDDKTLTHLALAGRLPVPDTVLCPQTYPGLGLGDMAFIAQAGEQLGWPMVIKEGCGSFGQQVYLAKNADAARAILRALDNRPALMQRFIAESAGRDARLFVVGGRVIAAIMRRNDRGDFRANIENGGNAIAYTPSADETRLAAEACALLGLDFAGVDILFGRDGPLLCEVNSNAHFAGLLSATGVNPAMHILTYIREAVCGA